MFSLSNPSSWQPMICFPDPPTLSGSNICWLGYVKPIPYPI